MGNSKRKNRRNDRNFAVGPMTQLEQVPLPEDAQKLGYVKAFENNKYGVFVKPSTSMGINGFMMQDEAGNQVPMQIMHLVIVRLDHKKETAWEDIQAIKTELMGPMVEAMELYPSEIRRIHNIVDHQTHLWCLYPGATIPVGLIPKAMEAMQQCAQDMTVTKDEIQVYAIKGEEITEVFSDEGEAKKAYEKNGIEMPEGQIMMIGEAPTEEEGTAWSDAAKAKIANVLNKSDQMQEMLDENKQGTEQAAVVDTMGPRTEHDDFEEDEEGMGCDEEADADAPVIMPMAVGIENMEKNRKGAVAKAQDLVADKLASDAEEKAKEELAKEELAKMRKEVIADKEKN